MLEFILPALALYAFMWIVFLWAVWRGYSFPDFHGRRQRKRKPTEPPACRPAKVS